jgi:hypothetical protein
MYVCIGKDDVLKEQCTLTLKQYTGTLWTVYLTNTVLEGQHT